MGGKPPRRQSPRWHQLLHRHAPASSQRHTRIIHTSFYRWSTTHNLSKCGVSCFLLGAGPRLLSSSTVQAIMVLSVEVQGGSATLGYVNHLQCDNITLSFRFVAISVPPRTFGRGHLEIGSQMLSLLWPHANTFPCYLSLSIQCR